MTQPYESAAEITALFQRMEVPLAVSDTKEKGKHVIATADLKDDSTAPNEDGSKKFGLKHRGGGKLVPSFDLFEESALVSWPTSELIATVAENKKALFKELQKDNNKNNTTPYFQHALVGSSNWSLKLLYADEKGDGSMYPTTTVPSNLFDKMKPVAPTTTTTTSTIAFTYADETEQQQDINVAAILGAGGALDSLRMFHANLEQDAGESYPTSVESVARCVAKAVSTFVQLFLRFSQSAPVVPANGDFTLVDKLFEASVRGYNRLVEPPKHSTFEAHIKPAEWSQEVRATLQPNVELLLTALNNAITSTNGKNNSAFTIINGELRLSSDAVSQDAEATSATPEWVSRVVGGWLSDETLTSLLGQITLNAQALVAVAPEEEKAGGGASVLTSSSDDGEECVFVTKSNVHKRLPIYGAGLYTLQSNFNHSCQPNAYVATPMPCGLGGHDIIVRAFADASTEEGGTTTPTTVCKSGDELCITYIPELYLHCEGAAKRRERLSSYFFQCACPKCKADDMKEEAAQKQK